MKPVVVYASTSLSAISFFEKSLVVLYVSFRNWVTEWAWWIIIWGLFLLLLTGKHHFFTFISNCSPKVIQSIQTLGNQSGIYNKKCIDDTWRISKWNVLLYNHWNPFDSKLQSCQAFSFSLLVKTRQLWRFISRIKRVSTIIQQHISFGNTPCVISVGLLVTKHNLCLRTDNY